MGKVFGVAAVALISTACSSGQPAVADQHAPPRSRPRVRSRTPRPCRPPARPARRQLPVRRHGESARQVLRSATSTAQVRWRSLPPHPSGPGAMPSRTIGRQNRICVWSALFG